MVPCNLIEAFMRPGFCTVRSRLVAASGIAYAEAVRGLVGNPARSGRGGTADK